MAAQRVRGTHLTDEEYFTILDANVVQDHIKDGRLWVYSSSNMKTTPKWEEAMKYRHLLHDLLRASKGQGVLQSSFQRCVMSWVEKKQHALKAQEVELGCYNVRVLLAQFREYRRSHRQVPPRYRPTLQVILHEVWLDEKHPEEPEAEDIATTLSSPSPDEYEDLLQDVPQEGQHPHAWRKEKKEEEEGDLPKLMKKPCAKKEKKAIDLPKLMKIPCAKKEKKEEEEGDLPIDKKEKKAIDQKELKRIHSKEYHAAEISHTPEQVKRLAREAGQAASKAYRASFEPK
jgi:hypothetical protein